MIIDHSRGSSRLRVMIVGPLPPPIGGATLCVESLVQRLRQRSDLEVFVVNTSRPPGNWMATLYTALRTLLVVALHRPLVDVVTFHANENGRKYLGPLIYGLTRVLRRPQPFAEPARCGARAPGWRGQGTAFPSLPALRGARGGGQRRGTHPGHRQEATSQAGAF